MVETWGANAGVMTIGTTLNSPQQSLSFSMGPAALVTIRADGKVEHLGYTPDEAAKIFWDAVGGRRALYEAAPEMLAALQFVAEDARFGSLPTNIQNAVLTAIAKATGRQS